MERASDEFEACGGIETKIDRVKGMNLLTD